MKIDRMLTNELFSNSEKYPLPAIQDDSYVRDCEDPLSRIVAW